MKKLTAMISACLIGTVISAGAFAGDKDADKKNTDTTEYTFSNEIVAGDLLRPDTTQVRIRKPSAARSLIKVRPHYIPEMLKAAEDI